MPLWKWLSHPLDLIYPPLCVLCSVPLSTQEQVCDRCLANLPTSDLGQWRDNARVREGLDEVWSAYWFDEDMKTLIHMLKYGGFRRVGRRLGAGVRQVFSTVLSPGDYDLIVPVPLHWSKRRQRGYNQADVLAEQLGRYWNIKVNRHVIVRNRATRSQTGLSITERRANIAGCFRVIKAGDGHRVLLIDDVLTTGATASACSVALRQGGYGPVAVLTVATPLVEG